MTERLEYHPAFPQPDDTSVLAWRYMDLAKLLSLILNRELYLRRLDLLPDKFEGTYPRRVLTALADAESRLKGTQLGHPTTIEIAKYQIEFANQTRKQMYVNCWHLANHESEAMWRIYSGADGLAVVLPYIALRSSISTGDAWIGTVTYLNYKTDVLNPGNVFRVALHKREEFSYESEARIVSFAPNPNPPPGDGPPFITIAWDTSLIQKVVINPYAPDWYLATVRETLEGLSPGMGGRVVASDMAGSPEEL
jgi:hypothetical protein